MSGRQVGLTPDLLIGFVLEGSEIGIRKREDGRVLVVRRGGRTRRELLISPPLYEPLMQAFVRLLAAGDGSRWRIAIHQERSGSQWIEVRSGFWGMRRSRITLSPRHIAALETAMNPQTAAALNNMLGRVVRPSAQSDRPGTVPRR